MDRKGKQKLKRYFIVYVIFAVFFTVGMYLITKYEENAKATQIALLLAEHPELEGEIVAIWEKSGTVDFIRDRDDQKIERVVQMLEETYGYHQSFLYAVAVQKRIDRETYGRLRRDHQYTICRA